MNTIVKTVLGAAAMIAATTTHASAQICIWFICLPIGGGGGSTPTPTPTPATPAAPEIDVTQGVAAVAVLAVALLLLRERFLRQRTGA